MRGLGAILCLSLCANTSARAKECPLDAQREKNIELEATQTLFDGNPVRIKNGASDFLGIWIPGRADKPTILLAHGPGRHVGSPVIAETSLALNALGYSTLSIQMPIQKKDCQGGDVYPQVFDPAVKRIDAAVGWLHTRGQRKLVLFAHWIGNVYLQRTTDAPFQAWIVNGLTGNFQSIGDNSLPVLDIYGSKGHAMTLSRAWLRRLWIAFSNGSEQVVIDGADHDFAGHYPQLATAIDRFLSKPQ